MAVTIYKEGMLPALQTLLTGVVEPNLRVHLFQNDFNPTLSAVLGDFEEADFPDYSVRGGVGVFGDPSLNSDNVPESDTATLTYTRGSPGGTGAGPVVYGYYVTYDRGTSEQLLFAERFTTPQDMSEVGATFDLQLALILDRA